MLQIQKQTEKCGTTLNFACDIHLEMSSANLRDGLRLRLSDPCPARRGSDSEEDRPNSQQPDLCAWACLNRTVPVSFGKVFRFDFPLRRKLLDYFILRIIGFRCRRLFTFGSRSSMRTRLDSSLCFYWIDDELNHPRAFLTKWLWIISQLSIYKDCVCFDACFFAACEIRIVFSMDVR